MSTTALRTNVPSGVSSGANPISTGNSVPSFRRANSSRPTPIARAIGASKKSPAIAGMGMTETLRHQGLDRTANNLFAGISKELFGLGIHQHDMALFVYQDNSIGRRFDRETKFFFC